MGKPIDTELPVVDSYSGGTSSEYVIQARIRGLLPRPKHYAVVFADTKLEHVWTYEAVDRVRVLCENEGIPFLRCSAPIPLGEHLISINRDNMTRADTPPVWIDKGHGARGQAMHKCTAEFKVAPMRRAVSQWLKEIGLPKRVIKAIGFGADEVRRANKAVAKAAKDGLKWERLDFPLIRLGINRAAQRAQLDAWTDGKAPRFSMCTICPWKTPERWRATPEGQRDSVYSVDESIRDLSGIGLDEGNAYLCDRLIPVERMIRRGDPQPYLPGFGDAGCDGGHCFL
jgi:hypothetical protein